MFRHGYSRKNILKIAFASTLMFVVIEMKKKGNTTLVQDGIQRRMNKNRTERVRIVIGLTRADPIMFYEGITAIASISTLNPS